MKNKLTKYEVIAETENEHIHFSTEAHHSYEAHIRAVDAVANNCELDQLEAMKVITSLTVDKVDELLGPIIVI